MAKSKKKKAKKAAKAVKAKKAAAKKAKAKKSAAKKPAKVVKAVAKKAAPKKPTPKKIVAKKAAAKKPAPKAKQKIVGEGDYEASRAFLKDQSSFVARNKAKIPAMGKQAEMALDGPEGADLKAAEAEAASHSKAAE